MNMRSDIMTADRLRQTPEFNSLLAEACTHQLFQKQAHLGVVQQARGDKCPVQLAYILSLLRMDADVIEEHPLFRHAGRLALRRWAHY